MNKSSSIPQYLEPIYIGGPKKVTFNVTFPHKVSPFNVYKEDGCSQNLDLVYRYATIEMEKETYSIYKRINIGLIKEIIRYEHDNNIMRGGHWSAAEHTLFIFGIRKYGWSNWKMISDTLISTRSRAQLANHAYKYKIKAIKYFT